MIKMNPDHRTLKILNFGPQEIVVKDKFNVQSNGLSAFWFEVKCQENIDLIVKFNDYCLKTVFDGKILTALVPDELLSKAGFFELKVFCSDMESAGSSLEFMIKSRLFKTIKKRPKFNFHISNKPNFFIIGAPRSGTTSMYWHLSSHCNIYMSKVKETFYFDDRSYGYVPSAVTNEISYSDLFKYAPINASVIGEATTTYLSSKKALMNIHAYNNNAKILIMLRDPIEASLSLFLRMKEGGVNESLNNMDDAWSDTVGRTFLNDYRELFKIGDQLEIAISVFGEEALKVVLFDDIINDSALVYEDILSFLNLPNDSRGSVRKGNSAKWKKIDSVVSARTYSQMVECFRPQVGKVSKLINRDMSHWLKPYENY